MRGLRKLSGLLIALMAFAATSFAQGYAFNDVHLVTLEASGNITTNVTGSTQCLHVLTTGIISGTGSDCTGATPSFSALTSGTNTTAAMLVGTGASLGTSGTGAINSTAIICTQHAALGHATANTITLECPAAVTAYEIVMPGAAATGLMHWTNAANVVTESASAIVSADLTITATTCTNQFISAISTQAAGTCTAFALASAQFANQGTTTTVLHGNAAGNPSFGAVNLATDVTGALSGGTVPFNTISSGTNATAAMLVGTGASLGVSGTGTINATTLNGTTFAAPAAIGTGTPAAATFTTLTSAIENCKNLDTVRCADQFAGADWIAQVNAANTDCGASACEIWVTGNVVAGTASTTLTLSTRHTLKFLGGTFSFSSTLNLNNTYSDIDCVNGSTLSYTGATNAISITNGSGNITQLRDNVRGCFLTTATGAIGVYVKDAYEWRIAENEIEGFSNAAIEGDATPATGGTFSGVVRDNKMLVNGRCMRWIGSSLAAINWEISFNRCQGSTVAAGLQYDVQATSQSIVSNDIEGNTVDQIVFLGGAFGCIIAGNHFETSATTVTGIRMSGGSTTGYQGVSITGNFFQANTVPNTGRALWFTTVGSGGVAGITFTGNVINGYGNSNNAAIDFNAVVPPVVDSVFYPNYFNPNVTTKFGASQTGSRVGIAVPSTISAPTYGPSIVIDTSLSDAFLITATNGTAFTITEPESGGTLGQLLSGQSITILIQNSSGGALGAISWNAAFVFTSPWVSPPNGSVYSITFRAGVSQANLYEVSRSAVATSATGPITLSTTGVVACATCAQEIASGTSTFTTTAVGALGCQTTVTTTATGAATTDTISEAWNSAPVAATDRMLTLVKWVTSGNVNFARCNPTAGSITPTALVLNWRVLR